jgi:hypothetical protein
MNDESGNILVDGFCIYQPELFSETFFLLFDKLAQLNDYCFNQLISSETKLRELATQRSSGYLDDQLPMWKDN